MAFNQRIAFEVDAGTGNDNNGGGFDDTTGSPGTNYAWGGSQQTFSITDLAIDSVSNTKVTSASSHPFTSAEVGNAINVTAGSGFTTGRYQILSVSAGAATLDRAVGTTSSTGGTATLGGALATIQKGIDAAWKDAGAVADCRVYVKYGSYTSTVALVTTGFVSAVKYSFRLIGYYATHGDSPSGPSGHQPTFAVGSGAGVPGLTITQAGVNVENITFDGAATSGSQGTKGINITSAQYCSVANCKIANFSQEGFSTNVSLNTLVRSEVTNCAGTTAAVQMSAGGFVVGCWIHKNTKCGVVVASGDTVIDCVISNNSGASSDGIQVAGLVSVIRGNTIYGNGRDGIRSVNQAYYVNPAIIWMNNVIAKNSGYAINANVAPALPSDRSNVNWNGFYSNTSGNYNNMSAGANDVAIAANPFVSSTSDLDSETSPDWSLNNTASAGASLRAAGFPGALPGRATPIGSRDIGFYQHADSGVPLSRVFTGF